MERAAKAADLILTEGRPVEPGSSTIASRSAWRAFTLVELLLVIAIVGILFGLLLPALGSAIAQANSTACLSNLRQIGVAIHDYAASHDGQIPFGPKAPRMMTASNFYPSTGAPTSLISLSNGAPVGLGLMLQWELSDEPRVLFCPGSDQPHDADAELAKVGRQQAQCSYYYRHGSVARQFDNPNLPDEAADHIDLANLGRNRNGRPIRALVIDTQFLVPEGFAAFGIVPRTHHGQMWANVLFSDGHVESRSNADGRYTVDLNDYDALRNAFDRILRVLETADEK